MKKILFCLLALVAGLAHADDDYAEVRAAMETLVPDATIDSIRPSPIAGYVEVLLGAQLVYVSENGQYLIDGQLIEIDSRRNLSEAAKGKVRQARIAAVDADQQFIFPATGERRHRITIFTDIDCGYCRRLHQQIGEYNQLGIEIDYLMFPRAGIGSESYDKAVSVWCADDRNAALTAAKLGEDPEPKRCPNPIEMHFNLGQELGVTGTPAILTADGTMIPGYVPPASLLQRLDAMQQTAAE